jgi:hypothetical protein
MTFTILFLAYRKKYMPEGSMCKVFQFSAYSAAWTLCHDSGITCLRVSMCGICQVFFYTSQRIGSKAILIGSGVIPHIQRFFFLNIYQGRDMYPSIAKNIRTAQDMYYRDLCKNWFGYSLESVLAGGVSAWHSSSHLRCSHWDLWDSHNTWWAEIWVCLLFYFSAS